MAVSSLIPMSCSLQMLPSGSAISVEDVMHFAPNVCSHLTGKHGSPCCQPEPGIYFFAFLCSLQRFRFLSIPRLPLIVLPS